MGNEQMTPENQKKYDKLLKSDNEKSTQLAKIQEQLKHSNELRNSDEKSFQSKIAELSGKNQSLLALEGTVATLTDKTRTLENVNMALEGKNESLTSDVGRLQKQADDEKKANADLREKLVVLKDQIKEGELKIGTLSKEVKRRDETLKEEKEKSAVKSKLEAELKVSKDKTSEQANEITALAMQLDGTKAQIASLQSAANKSNEEKDKLSNESKSTMKHLSDRREENAALGEQVKALKDQLETEKTKSSQLSKTCDDLKREIKEQTAEGNNAQIKVTGLEKDAERLTLKTEQQQATIDSLQEEARLLKETLESFQSKLRETEEAPKEREIELKVLKTEKMNLSKLFDEQKQAMGALISVKAQMLEDNSGLRETVASLKEQGGSLKVSLNCADKEVTDLKERMQSLEKENHVREKELNEKHAEEIATIHREQVRRDDLREKQYQETRETIKEMQSKAWDVMLDQNKGVRKCLEQTSDHLRTLTEQSQGVTNTIVRLHLEDKQTHEENE